MSRTRLVLLVLSIAVLGPVGAAAEHEQNRALLMLLGTVAAVEETPDPSGAKWTDATLIPAESKTPVRIRVAPSEILEWESFRISVGDTLQVRVFPDETPLGVQQVRNRSTGRTLRVRCLHGDPLWDFGRGRGDARLGPGRGKGGGPRHRGGR